MVGKCKYNYDGQCNLKYCECFEPEKCGSYEEDKFFVKHGGEDYV